MEIRAWSSTVLTVSSVTGVIGCLPPCRRSSTRMSSRKACTSISASLAGQRYSQEGDSRLREAEMLVQAFRDDIRVELRRHGGRHPITPVTLETVKTVLDQARISIRNSLD